MASNAQQKIAELTSVLNMVMLPQDLDLVVFEADGCYVWMYTLSSVANAGILQKFVVANQGNLIKDYVSGKLKYCFQVAHETCDLQGTPITLDLDTATAAATVGVGVESKIVSSIKPTTLDSNDVTINNNTTDDTMLKSTSTSADAVSTVTMDVKSEKQPITFQTEDGIEKTPLQIIKERQKQQQQQIKQETWPNQQQQQTPNESETNTQETVFTPKHITPLADYDAAYCSNCINPNANSKPCCEHLQCIGCKQTLLLQGIYTELKTIKNILLNKPSYEQLPEKTKEKTNTPTTIASTGNIIPLNPPATPKQTNTNTPTQQPQKTPQPTHQNEQLTPEEQERLTAPPKEAKNYFIEKITGLVWTKSVTKTGKPCEKAFKEKNLYQGNPSKAYKDLEEQISTKKFGNGYFYFTSDNTVNNHPYLARMQTQQKTTAGGG